MAFKTDGSSSRRQTVATVPLDVLADSSERDLLFKIIPLNSNSSKQLLRHAGGFRLTLLEGAKDSDIQRGYGFAAPFGPAPSGCKRSIAHLWQSGPASSVAVCQRLTPACV